MPNSLGPHRLQTSWLLCPWDFPGKDTGVVCHSLLQGIFPTQVCPSPEYPHLLGRESGAGILIVYLLAVWLCASHLTSLGLSFLVCKVGNNRSYITKFKCVNTCKGLIKLYGTLQVLNKHLWDAWMGYPERWLLGNDLGECLTAKRKFQPQFPLSWDWWCQILGGVQGSVFSLALVG